MLRSRATFAHKSLVLNEHYTSATPPVVDQTKLLDTITIDKLIVRPQYRDVRDALHLGVGGTAGRVHKGMLLLSMSGRILVPAGSQEAKLTDRELALRLALDPYECLRDSASTDGVYAFDWQAPTADTVNYPTGWLALRRYLRPLSQPETLEVVTDAAARQWSCGFVAPDPRLYEQAVQSSTGAPGSRNLTNKGSIPAPLRVTLTMGGAGASNFTITRSGVSFVLDLSGLSAGNTVVVVMETSAPFGRRIVTLNGAEAHNRKTSSPSTWLDVPSGTTSFTVANTTNITTILYEWYHARP
jgi:hypothetical protein